MTYFVTITLAPFYAFTFCNTQRCKIFKDTSTPNFEKKYFLVILLSDQKQHSRVVNGIYLAIKYTKLAKAGHAGAV